MDFPRYVDNPLCISGGMGAGTKSQGLRITRRPSQNIVNRLSGREMWGDYGRPGTEKHLQRSMQQSIFPNFSVANIDWPVSFLRKFTPDGNHLIAFSVDQRSIEVYHFKGPQAANHLFVGKGIHADANEDGRENPRSNNQSPQASSNDENRANLGFFDMHGSDFPDHIRSEDEDPVCKAVRRQLFDTFFSLKFRLSVAPQGEQLNRECLLFTEDYKYMILGSATYIPEEAPRIPRYKDIYRNNESVDPNPNYTLLDHSIHLVDIQQGVRSDTKTFKADKIALTYNQGIYLYSDRLAVLSMQHQTISLFQVQDGCLKEIQAIGRFCHANDEVLYSEVMEFRRVSPKDEMFMNGLKQRLLTHFFRKASKEALSSGSNDPKLCKFNQFYQHYEQLRKLKILKMQLLDEDNLLLKYANEDIVTQKCSKPDLEHMLFVFYNIPTAEVLAVYDNTSETLADLSEAFADNFRNNILTPDARYSSSPSNNIYSRQNYQRFRNVLSHSWSDGPVEGRRRLLSYLPTTAQFFSPSPYLDEALFCYDERKVSVLERRKPFDGKPIRFHGRDSMTYKFQLHTGIPLKSTSSTPPSSERPLISFTFHPSAPFAIGLQRQANMEFVAHIHFRLNPFSVMPL